MKRMGNLPDGLSGLVTKDMISSVFSLVSGLILVFGGLAMLGFCIYRAVVDHVIHP